MQNTPEQNKEYFESKYYLIWLELAINRNRVSE